VRCPTFGSNAVLLRSSATPLHAAGRCLRFSGCTPGAYWIMEPFEASIGRNPRLLRGLRGALAEWLEKSGVSDEEAAAVVLATHEAAASAIEQADEGTEVTVRAVVADDRVMVIVTSSGEWTEPLAGSEDRTVLTKALMSEVDVQIRFERSVVRMRKDLAEPADLGEEEQPSASLSAGASG